MPIFFLIYHVLPSTSNLNYQDVKGTYISAWIEADKIDQAKRIAFRRIEELDWVVEAFEEGKEVTKEDYTDNSSGSESFRRALIDKEAYSIHTYLSEDEE
jgi:hypothetical protein